MIRRDEYGIRITARGSEEEALEKLIRFIENNNGDELKYIFKLSDHELEDLKGALK